MPLSQAARQSKVAVFLETHRLDLIPAEEIEGQLKQAERATLTQPKNPPSLVQYWKRGHEWEAATDLKLSGLSLSPRHVKLTQYRIDADQSNCYDAWKRLGSPSRDWLNNSQCLKSPDNYPQWPYLKTIAAIGGKTTISLNLPRHAVALLILDGN